MNSKFIFVGCIFTLCVTKWPGLLGMDPSQVLRGTMDEVVRFGVTPVPDTGAPVAVFVVIGIAALFLAGMARKMLR